MEINSTINDKLIINTSLLLSTILMLQKSPLHDNLFKLSKNISKMNMLSYMYDIKLKKDVINNFKKIINEDIMYILENMDNWIFHYNSNRRMNMSKQLINNLAKIKEMLLNYININNQ